MNQDEYALEMAGFENAVSDAAFDFAQGIGSQSDLQLAVCALVEFFRRRGGMTDYEPGRAVI